MAKLSTSTEKHVPKANSGKDHLRENFYTAIPVSDTGTTPTWLLNIRAPITRPSLYIVDPSLLFNVAGRHSDVCVFQSLNTKAGSLLEAEGVDEGVVERRGEGRNIRAQKRNSPNSYGGSVARFACFFAFFGDEQARTPSNRTPRYTVDTVQYVCPHYLSQNTRVSEVSRPLRAKGRSSSRPATLIIASDFRGGKLRGTINYARSDFSVSDGVVARERRRE